MPNMEITLAVVDTLAEVEDTPVVAVLVVATAADLVVVVVVTTMVSAKGVAPILSRMLILKLKTSYWINGSYNWVLECSLK